MRRREFIGGLAGAVAWPLAPKAQPRLPTIGLLSSVPFETRRDQLTGFHAGLKQLGFLEQQNVAVEYRSAENRLEQLPTLAAELVEHEVSVIVTIGGDIAIIAAKAATATIPIVFVTGNDPVKNRYVASLNRPGGNLTGISFLVNLTVSKRLELLCEVVPSARKIAMLANANNPNTPASIKTALSTAGMLGRGVLPISVATESQIAEAFHTLDQDNQDKAEALVVEADPFLLARREQIVSLANYQRLPTMYSFREFAAIGGLMSYGASLASAYREAGIYAARILHGERPGELPVLQSSKLDFVINVAAAKSIGLGLTPAVLARADEVIE